MVARRLSTPTPPSPESDTLLRVRGVVQGVGFRPFVHRVATRLGLRGWVRNDSEGVLIRAVGPAPAVTALMRALKTEAPRTARVQEVEARPTGAADQGPAGAFSIASSGPGGLPVATALPPDLALCPDCRRELLNPKDRRHRYPFINCTQCGPRYSILEKLPYDRPNTTMRAFRMCPACAAEYSNPSCRRFHAQPNACPDCGPRIALRNASGGKLAGEAALKEAVGVLSRGGILALKGIGGYHLMVDAGNDPAVAELRRRKQRDEKPFAVMFPDMAAVRLAAETSAESEGLLASPAAPVVLLRRRPQAALAPSVAPGNPWVGALLPYSPLHVLLLAAYERPLVATSGNLAEEPLCTEEKEAHERLAGIADAFLDHDRTIAHPVDDSVVRLSAAGPIRLRRARGYAPAPLRLPGRIDGSWLCVGAQMKNTVAVAAGNQLVLSPHIGDLDGAPTRAVFQRTASMLREIHGKAFTGVVCDRHPDYASTLYARATGLPCIAVQHHLAHVLACLLEHGRKADAVLGVAWDGTGYGEDGTIWGGEFILLNKGQARRFARLRPFRLPGGEAAIRDGRRAALGLAHAAGDPAFGPLGRRLGFSDAETGLLETMLERGVNSPVTTSAGRLFDAVGALLGLGAHNRFEGQIPLALEAAASGFAGTAHALPLPLRPVHACEGAIAELDWEPLIAALEAGRLWGRDPAEMAASFHHTLARGIVAAARAAGAGTVALGGGCFQNALLLGLTSAALKASGFEVLVPRELPPNDGAIAAGQALGALWNLTTVRTT
jgi:hydrogenase maturation protein HypF